MTKRTRMALAVSAALLLAALLIIYFHPRGRRDRMSRGPQITELVGVGIAVRTNPQHAVVVQQVLPNTPAAEARITAGLLIRKVDGISLDGKPLVECVQLIRGPIGSTVQLELAAPDTGQTHTVELTRRKISL